MLSAAIFRVSFSVKQIKSYFASLTNILLQLSFFFKQTEKKKKTAKFGKSFLNQQKATDAELRNEILR